MDICKKKYLKYKQKYLNLKTQLDEAIYPRNKDKLYQSIIENNVENYTDFDNIVNNWVIIN